MVPEYGGEGLDNTMKENIELLQESDYVWIFTDGYIDEKPLDKSFYNMQGIRTHAMYIGDVSCKSKMQDSFDYVICEDSVMNLAKEIFHLVKFK